MFRITLIGLCLCMVSPSEAQEYGTGVDHPLFRHLPVAARDDFFQSAFESFTDPLKDAASFAKSQMSVMEGFRMKLAAHLKFFDRSDRREETGYCGSFREGYFVPAPLNDRILSDEDAYEIFRMESCRGIIAPMNRAFLKEAAHEEAAQTSLASLPDWSVNDR